MFLAFCKDAKTDLNSRAPTKLGRIGVIVVLLLPQRGRVARMLLVISAATCLSRSSSSSPRA